MDKIHNYSDIYERPIISYKGSHIRFFPSHQCDVSSNTFLAIRNRTDQTYIKLTQVRQCTRQILGFADTMDSS